jgi:hypothetical protein
MFEKKRRCSFELRQNPASEKDRVVKVVHG